MLVVVLFGVLFAVPALVLRLCILKRKASLVVVAAYSVVLYFFHSITMSALVGDAVGVGLSVSLSVLVMLWQPRSEFGSNNSGNGGPGYPGDRAL